MSYKTLSMHAGHDGSLHLLASDDVSGTGSSYALRLNTLTPTGWSGWQQVETGSGAKLHELRRFPDGRLVIFGWPSSDGKVSVRIESAPGSRTFSSPQMLSVPDGSLASASQFLVRRHSDGRLELFVLTAGRASRTIQSAPNGAFSSLVDLDGSASTPVDRLACAGEAQGAVPMLWGIDANGNLRAAQPSTDAWRWFRTVDHAERVESAFYEGRRGSDELFFVTDVNRLVGHRTVGGIVQQTTVLNVPVGQVSNKHLVGHYAGDGRLYLFMVYGSQENKPAVISELSPGSAWQANGTGWSSFQAPDLLNAPPVRRLCAASFLQDGRLAFGVLFNDGSVRVSTQASLGSTSWSPWALVTP